ncbi:MAG: 2-amino-4-hydroxy-6-hydroxymethyldihydropteridine diphosphokinase [Crocinitomicaceae bacterium]|nr:2-amino-4-hydroxy-6-hydroxymethyldihydropteridine diphosphokinase [Crocinitomicaceae bacterium]
MEIKRSLILALGSNLGNREELINQAYELIETYIGTIKLKSAFYENEAVGFESKVLFINSCIEVETNLAPLEILKFSQRIEKDLGRVEKLNSRAYESRKIDIDIILLDTMVYSSEILTIPHKLYRNRLFVLAPLLEIAKHRIDPITQLTIYQIVEINKANS